MKSGVEAVAGHPIVSLAATAAAATGALASSVPPLLPVVYAFLPVLIDTLARGRAEKRWQKWAEDVNEGLRALGDRFDGFSDAQYRLLVGICQTAFETFDEEKLRLLKAAVLNVSGSDFLGSHEAQLFSRILRDVSAAEISFLVEHRGYVWLTFMKPFDTSDTFFIVDPQHEIIVRGLISLGLINRSASEGLSSDAGGYKYAPFVPRLIDLIVGQGN